MKKLVASILPTTPTTSFSLGYVWGECQEGLSLPSEDVGQDPWGMYRKDESVREVRRTDAINKGHGSHMVTQLT